MTENKEVLTKAQAMKQFLLQPENAFDCVNNLIGEFKDLNPEDIDVLRVEEMNGVRCLGDIICRIRTGEIIVLCVLDSHSCKDEDVIASLYYEESIIAGMLLDCTADSENLPQIITEIIWVENTPYPFARSLREITHVVCEEWFNDYAVHITEPYQFDMEAYFSSEVHTDFESVLAFIHASHDVTMLKRILNDRNIVQNLGKEAVQAISAVTQAPIEKYIEEKGEVTMKTCWNELIEEQRNIGIAKGLEQGIEKGIAQGKAEGREEGLRMGRESGKKERNLEICMNMFKENLPVETISVCTGLSEEEISSVRESMQA